MRSYKFASCVLLILLATSLQNYVNASTVKVGILSNSGVQRSMYSSFAKEFEQANPGITIELMFRADAEYKQQLTQWFENGNGPDILNWQGGERLFQYVRAGRVKSLNTFWQVNGLQEQFSQASIGAVSVDGEPFAVPVSYYQWGFYYRESLFKKYQLSAPSTWNEFLDLCDSLKAKGVVPITIGAQYKWPTAAWFDYLNLRINGLPFHQKLLKGEIPFTDPRVAKVFGTWKELLDNGCFVDRYNGWNWQQAMPFMYHKLAGMTLIGNFFAGTLPEVIKDDFKFFPFPQIDTNVAQYEEAPLDLFMIPSYAKTNPDAEKFLKFLASQQFQQEFNNKLGMISPNLESEISQDYFIQQGASVLKSATGVSQFFDRDTNADMANAATAIFTTFMDDQDIQGAVHALEQARQQHLL